MMKSTNSWKTWAVIIVLSGLDAQILHALQLSPRASFRSIGAVLGASEQAVARRYHGMRRNGVMRVVGFVNPAVHGNAQWLARIHARPDRLPQLADVLARRSEIAYASILSGGTELVCVIRAPVAADSKQPILEQLPRTAAVMDISIDLVLHSFGRPETGPWTGYAGKLGAEQVRQLLGQPARTPIGQLIAPTPQDRPLLDALSEDGRTPYSRLAELTGWSVARVVRRVAALEESGTLVYDVDVLPERLGYHVTAMLWLTAAPQHLVSIGEQIAAHDEIAYAGATSGRNNLMAIAICRDVDDLYRYLTEQLAAVDHLHAYDVSIRRQVLKQSASVVALGRLITTMRTSSRLS